MNKYEQITDMMFDFEPILHDHTKETMKDRMYNHVINKLWNKARVFFFGELQMPLKEWIEHQ